MDVVIRPLRATDLPDADRIFRLAFGTFIGLPDPMQFAGDSDWIATRWRALPEGAFAAEIGGRLVGSIFVARWGSLGYLGPLIVHPDSWNRGVGQRLLAPAVDLFDRWGVTHAGLFTFAQSQKHVGSYGRVGFYPRFLTAIMRTRVEAPRDAGGWSTYDRTPHDERARLFDAVRALTDAVYPGLDPAHEIRVVAEQRLGDTVVVEDGGALGAVAVCHCGAGSEAGSDTCYVKLATVRPDGDAAARFERLLDAVHAFAANRGLRAVVAGVNFAHEDAYRRMLARGFRTEIQGVAMHRPNAPGYHRPELYVLDDWR